MHETLHSLTSDPELAGVQWGWWEGINLNSIKIITEVWSWEPVEGIQNEQPNKQTKNQNMALWSSSNYQSLAELAIEASSPVTWYNMMDLQEHEVGSQMSYLRTGDREQMTLLLVAHL